MKAAVITTPGNPPSYHDVNEPILSSSEEMLIQVLAVGLHPVTRARAAGTHYTNVEETPSIAGIDGVGIGSDGKLRYFVQSERQPGSMAEHTIIALDHAIELSVSCDPVLIAGSMNPAMSSWLALRCRLSLRDLKGKRILIIGATGCSGYMAVQIAKYMGASEVIAAGRNKDKLDKLPAIGATEAITLCDEALPALVRNVDIVLDFVWGESSVRIMETILEQRSDRSQPLDWVHVGSTGGDTAPVPGALLRSANLQLLGSGYGAISGRDILKELPLLVKEISLGKFHLDIRRVPLSEVERAWSDTPAHSGRIVFTI
ncbi:TPA: zinc-binding alcohol dehydrogenase family protein [Klebsiella pneumoniae]|nr:zinc-binding alcohol dehydrogenase family protein [Klebsiella pneumoniae]